MKLDAGSPGSAAETPGVDHPYTKALNARFGPASSVEDYTMKSQLMAYESTRAMFEAFSANKYESTGIIQWMLNNSRPSLI